MKLLHISMPLLHISMPLLALSFLLAGRNTALATLPPPEGPYNILMLTPVSSKSHRNVFLPLASALANRGHKVTFLNNHPADGKNPNITFIKHGLPYFLEEHIDTFEIRESTELMMKYFEKNLRMFAKEFYDLPVIQKLYERKNEFDVVMVDTLSNEIALPFTHRKPFIAVAPAGFDGVHSATFGNFQNPAYVVCMLKLYERPLTLWNRMENIFISILYTLQWKNKYVYPTVQKEISKFFPELPSVVELERNQSLVLYNSHFSISEPSRLGPGQIEVGGMHCNPGKPLPENINKFVSGSETVIYFSLGTYSKGTAMPQKYLDIFISAFKKLPYKILWKYEENLENLPKNVMTLQWIPQQDVLAHPNVKVFMSHCGMFSTQESMYHAIPVLALPVFLDQPRNAKHLVMTGLARIIVWEELTEELLIDTIEELLTNPTYQTAASTVSRLFRDQPQPAVERAVYWTEYVIRHSGAVHLRSPERDISWVELLHLDILLLLYVILFAIVWILRKMFKMLFRSCTFKKLSKKKRE